MKTREVIAICLKLMAVYVVFQFLMMLPAAIGMFQAGSRMPPSAGTDDFGGRVFLWFAAYYAVLSLAYLGFACVLFLGADRLSRLFVTGPDDEMTISGQVSDSLLTAAFRCMGLWALATWFPNLVHSLVRCVIYGTWTEPQTPFLRRFYDNWSGLLSPATGVFIGLLLVFQADGLMRLIRLSRPMSRAAPEPKGE